MPSLVKRHFPPGTTRCHFSPERVLPPPPFAMKMTFPPEGPLVSPTSLGTARPELNDSIARRSARDKLKQTCSTLLHWGNDQFEEVEVTGQSVSTWTSMLMTSSAAIRVRPH
jgi:hypothetical protein